jgi:16S rRNA (uracil1498-N3)-methyltransferase
MTNNLQAEFHAPRSCGGIGAHWRALPNPAGGGIVARMSERFYINWPLAPGAVLLDGPEAHHLATVCRLRTGDAVCLFNGDGHEYPARVATVARRQVELEIVECLSPRRELPFRLEVAAPLPKGDRAQFLVEKLTETGVTAFVPLATKRSVVHPRDAKLEKLQRYVIEASKQCGRNVLMTVSGLVDWKDYCRRDGLPKRRYLAQPGGVPLRGIDQSSGDVVADTVWAVGPEGGFTEEEVEHATKNGWRCADFGPRILRVETAALAAAVWSASF